MTPSKIKPVKAKDMCEMMLTIIEVICYQPEFPMEHKSYLWRKFSKLGYSRTPIESKSVKKSLRRK